MYLLVRLVSERSGQSDGSTVVFGRAIERGARPQPTFDLLEAPSTVISFRGADTFLLAIRLHFPQAVNRKIAISSVLVAVALLAVGWAMVGPLFDSTDPTRPAGEFEFQYSQNPDGTYRVTAVFQGGREFTPENTERLELVAEDGEPAQFPLPTELQDSVSIDGVQSGTMVRVVWWGPESRSSTIAGEDVP